MTPAMAAARRKELGAFYTPPEMAQALADWAIRTPNDRVLDPSFGGQAFFEAARKRLAQLGLPQGDIESSLFGAELDSDAFARAIDPAESHGEPRLVQGDFLELEVEQDLPRVEAVLGNPPYVRYQGFNRNGDVGHRRAAAAGVELTRLASSWAPFVLHATAFVESHGRLALVLPAEILHAQYAQGVLDFVRRSFARSSLVLFEERVFPGALEEVVLLLAEERSYDLTKPGSLTVQEFANLAAFDATSIRSPVERHRTRRGGADKLLAGLLPEPVRDLYSDLASRARDFGALASVDIGAVTGANEFFLVPRDSGLPTEHLRPAVSKALHISGARFSGEDHQRLLANKGPGWMLVIDRDHDLRPGRLNDYIAEGQARGFDQRYKCRVRSPWWSLPLPGHGVPAAFLTYCSAECPRLVLNEAGALHTNTLHGVSLIDDATDIRALTVGFYNSLTQLSAELAGRSYGGGVLKLEPTEAERLLLPPLPAGLAELLPSVDAALRDGRFREAVATVDDAVLVAGMGLGSSEVAALRNAAERLRTRRRSRGRPA